MKRSVDGCENEVTGFHYYREDFPLNSDGTGENITAHCVVEKVDGCALCEYHIVRGGARLREEYEKEMAGESKVEL